MTDVKYTSGMLLLVYLVCEYIVQLRWIKKRRESRRIFSSLFFDLLYAGVVFGAMTLLFIYVFGNDNFLNYASLIASSTIVSSILFYKRKINKGTTIPKFALLNFGLYNLLNVAAIVYTATNITTKNAIDDIYLKWVAILIGVIILFPVGAIISRMTKSSLIPYSVENTNLEKFHESMERFLVAATIFLGFSPLLSVFILIPRFMVSLRTFEASWNKDSYILSIFVNIFLVIGALTAVAFFGDFEIAKIGLLI